MVWVGALPGATRQAPEAAELLLGDRRAPVAWKSDFDGRIFTDEIALDLGDSPVEAQLFVGEKCCASARVGAPPATLPGPGERPYTVLVGSCYCVSNDTHARLAKAAAALERANATPDVKFLCGDQVYLDTPPNYTWTEHPREELIDKFFENYATTWSDKGMLPLLKQGATYFTSDDHEFWNEYPAMRGKGGRTADYEWVSRELFKVFQRREDEEPFNAGEVSFFALDTRLDREEELTRFARPERLAEVESWLDSLKGPGVLVLGETFFGEERSVGVSLTRLVGDIISQPTITGTLVEYEQYKELASMLARSKKTVVLISGDVHWGRISECTMPNGTRLIEVVSSPFTLVDSGLSRLGRPWTKAPTPFEAAGLSAEVHTIREPSGDYYKAEYDHFCTLELSRDRGGKIRMAVRHWHVDEHKNDGQVVYETLL